MTLSDINSKISFLTGADTTAAGFPTADRVISINAYYNRVITNIYQASDEIDFDDYSNTTSYSVAVRNLVANQQDYKFSTASWALLSPEGAANQSNASISPFRIQRVEISYDSTNWYKAEAIDLDETAIDSTQTSINNVFQTSKPFYRISNNAIYMYPVPIASTTATLKIWFDRQMTEYTASDLTTGTKVPGFDANFHQILAYGPSYEFALTYGKENGNELKKELEQLMAELRQWYGQKQKDRQMFLKGSFTPYT